MFDHLTLADMGGIDPGARVYLQPACFVERPHGLDGRTARIGDGLLWFTGWQFAIRDPAGQRRDALVQVADMAQWLDAMPADVAHRADAQIRGVSQVHAPLTLGGRTVRLNEPQIMGILNVTPDSFSDGGKFVDADAAVAAGVSMSADGAAIIDVGGESTRPGAPVLWEGDEAQRVIPVIERLAQAGIALSVDTRKSSVMEAALAAGAHIINDVGALAYDDRALALAARAQCPVVLMHAPSQSSNPHDMTTLPGGRYGDAALDVFDWLAARVDSVVAGGVMRHNILIDPGLGFGKGVEDNLRIMNALPLFHAIGCPLLVGASRKRMIGAIDNEAPADARLGGSLALVQMAAQAGAQIHRVHDVAETRQMLRVWRATRDASLTRL